MTEDSNIVRPSITKARRSENSRVYFKLIVFQIDRVSLTSTDSYRCDSYCLAQVFQNLPAPPKHFGIFDVFPFRKFFFQPENLGSHLAMSPDDRFLPQGKQIFPKICQVRPMPIWRFLADDLKSDSTWKKQGELATDYFLCCCWWWCRFSLSLLEL